MRISDWSSDVCSSDLGGGVRGPAHVRESSIFHSDRRWTGRRGTWLESVRRSTPSAPPLDRKSVVWGKSVSVRVDLGGRSSIKKKTQITRTPANITYTLHNIQYVTKTKTNT